MLRVLFVVVLFVVVSNIPNFFVNVKAKLSTYENGDMWKTFSCESVYYYYREPNPKPLLIIILHFIPDYDSAHAFFPYSLFSARALSKKKRGKFSNLPRSHFQNVSLRQSYCSSPRCSAYCSASAISESLPFSCSSSMSRTYA